ncbi:hypothetical protein BRCH_03942c [Candidatus Burkholderia brachyanthoides]|nr:hypothetical protein BRCH_03942c [Candidatus Burkholderia brachyanthoides]
MADVVTFVPRSDLDAQANLMAFIELCRTQLTIFGHLLDFKSDIWDVSKTIKTPGKTSALRLIFSNLDTCNKPQRIMMREPFKSFAKSLPAISAWHEPDTGRRQTHERAQSAGGRPVRDRSIGPSASRQPRSKPRCSASG